MIANRIIREADMQASLFAEIDYRANQDPRWKYIFHVPNGGARDKRTAAIMKGYGVRPGVPDLVVPVPRAKTRTHEAYHGAFIELKVGKNQLSLPQKEWTDFLHKQGYYVAVVWDSADEVMDILEWYLDGDK